MAEHKCVDGCGRRVSREGGRCRTCAGRLRQKNRTPREDRSTGGAIEASGPAAKGLAVAVEDVLAGLHAAGLRVSAVEVWSGRVRIETEREAPRGETKED